MILHVLSADMVTGGISERKVSEACPHKERRPGVPQRRERAVRRDILGESRCGSHKGLTAHSKLEHLTKRGGPPA